MTINTQKLLSLFDTAAQTYGWAGGTGTVGQFQTALTNYQKARGDLEQALDAQTAEIARLRDALDGAATSLNTIATLAGSKDDYMEDMFQVRGYAHSRARVARAALSGESKC